MTEQYLTIGEVAKCLKVSTSTVRRAIEAGHLAACRVGTQSQLRVSEKQLSKYLKGSTKNGRPINGHSLHLVGKVGAAMTLGPTKKKELVYQGVTDSGLEWKVINSDVLLGLSILDSNSVNCIVTSPPYYWQRDYEVDGQIGHEKSINEYVTALRNVFREAWRVLRDDGVIFLNLGDTYYSAKGKPHGQDSKHRARQLSRKQLRAVDGPGLGVPRKSLLGIPWRVAFAMQDDGWVLRSSIVWQRPASMPEPTAHDRPWRTHEPVFLFSKQPKYWFNRDALKNEEDIWHIAARSDHPGAHFAPYPLEFADRCVSAGCPVGGTVLDPFVGSGTTMLAALSRGMSAVGIDLKREYCDFIKQRIEREYPKLQDSKTRRGRRT